MGRPSVEITSWSKGRIISHLSGECAPHFYRANRTARRLDRVSPYHHTRSRNRSSFVIRHSSFVIRHSSFVIHGLSGRGTPGASSRGRGCAARNEFHSRSPGPPESSS